MGIFWGSSVRTVSLLMSNSEQLKNSREIEKLLLVRICKTYDLFILNDLKTLYEMPESSTVK